MGLLGSSPPFYFVHSPSILSISNFKRIGPLGIPAESAETRASAVLWLLADGPP